MNEIENGEGWRKSSFCSGGNCVEVRFVRSTFCADKTCVEVAQAEDHVLVRDGKDPSGPWLAFTREEFAAFTAGVRAGEFDFN